MINIRTRKAIPALVLAMMVWTAAPLAAMTDTRVTDEEITSAAETEFWVDDAVDANELDVKTQRGVVTLTGTVDNVLAKERAERIVETMVGVRSIVNRIKVEPPTEMDDSRIRQAVKDALFLDPATEAYEVTGQVADGIVTLKGTVDSYGEKRLAETVAMGVAGVRAVTNDITVRYTQDRPDYEISNEVKARIKNDVRVDDRLIRVTVEDGKVTLTGDVGSLSEKRQAYDDAWVAGVRSVDTEGLEIAWFVRDRLRRKSAYVDRDAPEIEKAVKDAFLYDPRVLSFKLGVEVDSGTATLTGVVDNRRARTAAEEDARNTLGVWRVKNHIKVRPEEVPTDRDLEERVGRALLLDTFVDRNDLSVSANSGWVYLSGDVTNSFEKRRAELVAQSVKGVVGVVSTVDYDYEWRWKADLELEEDVEEQLFWSPFVDRDDVHVEARKGKVILTGTVATLGERKAAESNAWQAGAKDVVNNLNVLFNQYGPYYPYWRTPYPSVP